MIWQLSVSFATCPVIQVILTHKCSQKVAWKLRNIACAIKPIIGVLHTHAHSWIYQSEISQWLLQDQKCSLFATTCNQA